MAVDLDTMSSLADYYAKSTNFELAHLADNLHSGIDQLHRTPAGPLRNDQLAQLERLYWLLRSKDPRLSSNARKRIQDYLDGLEDLAFVMTQIAAELTDLNLDDVEAEEPEAAEPEPPQVEL